ncbi:hypothetical protein IWW50_007022, partial [Coemansia erecta]
MPVRGERGATLRRGRTLVRSERQQAPEPMIKKEKRKLTPWVIYSRIISFWAPGILLTKLGKMPDAGMQQAWREKVALVSLIILVCGIVVYITIFLATTFCPQSVAKTQYNVYKYEDPAAGGIVGIKGWAFSTENATWTTKLDFTLKPGQDLTPYVNVPIPPSCSTDKLRGSGLRALTQDVCGPNNGNGGCPLGNNDTAIKQNHL